MRGLDQQADDRDRQAAEPDLPGGAGIGGRWIGHFLESTVPTAKPIAPTSAMMIPGSLASLAAMPLPPMIEASPANAITSASVRSSVGRSPSTGQAISEAQTGMV